jgi:hypothetical protein
MEKLKALGMAIYIPTPDEVAKFRKAAEGPTRAWAEKQWGKDFVDQFYAIIDVAAKK